MAASPHDIVPDADVLTSLREALNQRPGWRGYSPHQLAVLLFLHGYTSKPAEDFDVESALEALLDEDGELLT